MNRKISHLVKRFLVHPQRRLAVMVTAVLTALVTMGPPVNRMIEQRRQHQELLATLQDMHIQLAQLDELRSRAELTSHELKTLDERMVHENDAYRLRSKLVALTRSTGCSIRQINLSQPRSRGWFENDHPLKNIPRKNKKEVAKFELRSQHVSLVVSGSLGKVLDLLHQLHDMEKIMHAESFELTPVGNNRRSVTLELELILYGLEKTKKKGISA